MHIHKKEYVALFDCISMFYLDLSKFNENYLVIFEVSIATSS